MTGVRSMGRSLTINLLIVLFQSHRVASIEERMNNHVMTCLLFGGLMSAGANAKICALEVILSTDGSKVLATGGNYSCDGGAKKAIGFKAPGYTELVSGASVEVESAEGVSLQGCSSQFIPPSVFPVATNGIQTALCTFK